MDIYIVQCAAKDDPDYGMVESIHCSLNEAQESLPAYYAWAYNRLFERWEAHYGIGLSMRLHWVISKQTVKLANLA